jgi:hypothetical protein
VIEGAQDREPKPVLRVLSAFGGVVVLLVSLLFSLGSSLAAPIGFFVASRRAHRRAQPLSRMASWLSAVFASIIMLTLGVLVLFAFLPSKIWQEMRKVAAEAQATQDTVPPPAWATKMFPRTARSDSIAHKVSTSPGIFYVSYGIGVLFVCVCFGAIGGSMGWAATVLLRYAFWGVRT